MKKLIIIVDVQNAFMTRTSGWLPLKLANYLEKNNYDGVVATRYINHKNTSCYKYLGYKECEKPYEIAICQELGGLYDRVFNKDTYTGVTSDMLIYLQANNFDEIHICGISSDCCVLATAFDLFDIGYNIKVIPDLCAVTNPRRGYKQATDFMLRENFPCLDIK